MLETRDLTKVYNESVLAVNKLNLKIDNGEIYVVLGANGAGKSTTISMLLNFIEPTSGTALVGDIEIPKFPLEAKKASCLRLRERRTLSQLYSTAKPLLSSQNSVDAKRYQTPSSMPPLNVSVYPKKPLRDASRHSPKGMRQRLGIAIAIMKNAQAVLLDEPTSGLDPKGGADFLNLLRELKGEGKSIFMSTHDIFRAKEIADRIGILVQGTLERELTREEILKEDLEALYLHYVAGYEPADDSAA